MRAEDRPRNTLYVVLFALAVALAYLVGLQVERGRQNRAKAEPPSPPAAVDRTPAP